MDAEIHLDRLPKSKTLQKQRLSIQNQFSACGGDDYEICFTAPRAQRDLIHQLSKNLNLPLTCIGQTAERKSTDAAIKLIDRNGASLNNADTVALLKSFDHFAS